MLDAFFKGGETIRGFESPAIGPRDLGSPNHDALGGQTYWAATAELRMPIPFVPDDMGLSWAIFADAGSLWGATGGAWMHLPSLAAVEAAASLPACRQLLDPVVGRRQPHVELACRPDPHGLRQGPDERELRRDAVLPVWCIEPVLTGAKPQIRG